MLADSVVFVLTSSAEDNDRIYGKCANPAGHGHDYGFEIAVSGPLDPATGRIFDPDALGCAEVLPERAELTFAGMVRRYEAYTLLRRTALDAISLTNAAMTWMGPTTAASG